MPLSFFWWSLIQLCVNSNNWRNPVSKSNICKASCSRRPVKVLILSVDRSDISKMLAIWRSFTTGAIFTGRGCSDDSWGTLKLRSSWIGYEWVVWSRPCQMRYKVTAFLGQRDSMNRVLISLSVVANFIIWLYLIGISLQYRAADGLTFPWCLVFACLPTSSVILKQRWSPSY